MRYDEMRFRNSVRIKTRAALSAPSDICEVCGRDISVAETESWHTSMRHKSLVAHHWNGYEHPFDVWWICYRCNSILTMKHDGSLTIEQAHVYVHSSKRFTDAEQYRIYREKSEIELRQSTYLNLIETIRNIDRHSFILTQQLCKFEDYSI